jgi:hypothetical protein
MIGVGTLSTGIAAEVDADGTVHHGAVRVGWRVRSGNDWLTPGRDTPARQSRPYAAPVVHTALRIAGGDAVERVYAVGDGEDAIVVVEVENDSPEAIGVGFVVDAPGTVEFDDEGARVGGAPVVAFARRPGAVEDSNMVVFAVPHRTKVRVALAPRPGVDVKALTDAETVVRAFDRILDRGLRTELPEPLQSEVDAARADLLLAPPTAEAFVVLEAWGLDNEAAAMWERLPGRARRVTKRVPPTGVLAQTLAALVSVRGRTIDVLPGFRVAWLGQPVAAHDVPLRRGLCSFAVRWHGARPALLWDVPPGTTVRAPALDPAWSSSEPVGETLLAEPPMSLLAMGERSPSIGTVVEAPEQFS